MDKFNVSIPVERISKNGVSRFVHKNFDLRASHITRSRIGSLDRFYYGLIIVELPDEFLELVKDEFSRFLISDSNEYGKHIRCNLNRKTNKKFNPKKYTFKGNICKIK